MQQICFFNLDGDTLPGFIGKSLIAFDQLGHIGSHEPQHLLLQARIPTSARAYFLNMVGSQG